MDSVIIGSSATTGHSVYSNFQVSQNSPAQQHGEMGLSDTLDSLGFLGPREHMQGTRATYMTRRHRPAVFSKNTTYLLASSRAPEGES